jgi:hypothetical protein
MKQDALSPLLFNFAFEYAIKKTQANQEGLSRTQQILVDAGDVNILGGSIHFCMAGQTCWAQASIVEVSRSHSVTPHSVGLLRTSDQPDANYLTTHDTYKRETTMSPAGFESAIPVSERPQTQALDLLKSTGSIATGKRKKKNQT